MESGVDDFAQQSDGTSEHAGSICGGGAENCMQRPSGRDTCFYKLREENSGTTERTSDSPGNGCARGDFETAGSLSALRRSEVEKLCPNEQHEEFDGAQYQAGSAQKASEAETSSNKLLGVEDGEIITKNPAQTTYEAGMSSDLTGGMRQLAETGTILKVLRDVGDVDIVANRATQTSSGMTMRSSWSDGSEIQQQHTDQGVGLSMMQDAGQKGTTSNTKSALGISFGTKIGSGWAMGGGMQQQHARGMMVKGCRCCFPPDTMFEDACDRIMLLGLCTALNAQKFVKLCGGGSGTMQLSKKGAKVAVKLGKEGQLFPEQIQEMQRCVNEAYSEILGFGHGDDALREMSQTQ